MEDGMWDSYRNQRYSILIGGYSGTSLTTDSEEQRAPHIRKPENGKKDLKDSVFGTPEFAVASLDRLVEGGGYDVEAVVTMPDKTAGRGHRLIQSDVKKYAEAHGLEVLQPDKLRAENFLTRLSEIDADLFIVIAFRMLPEAVWAMPRLGTFNLHASVLPAVQRGGSHQPCDHERRGLKLESPTFLPQP